MGLRVLAVGCWLLLPTLVGCGGRVDTGDPQESGEATTGAAAKSGASSDPGTASNAEGDTELGSCTRGPLEVRATGSCAWVADDRCYDTREMACNCACPRSHDSQCASGFDEGPNGHVWVTCN